MKFINNLYIIPFVLSFATACALIYWYLPPPLASKGILISFFSILVLTLVYQVITNRRIGTIQTQLQQIIQTLEEFDLEEPQKTSFKKSPFPIFNELNSYIIELINRIRKNYQANKQFTQNASHELQTPLAIIKGHLELLLQSPNIGEREMESLGTALQNTNRLARLNSALILLSKIEHQHFLDTTLIDFEYITKETLENFHDLIQIKALQIDTRYKGHFQKKMSQTLSEILIANLVQNAIRHNIEKGFIKIEIEDNKINISNSGLALLEAPQNLFKRFKRISDQEESLGLGLSIVKRICDQYNLDVSYSYQDKVHNVRLEKIE